MNYATVTFDAANLNCLLKYLPDFYFFYLLDIKYLPAILHALPLQKKKASFILISINKEVLYIKYS